MKDTATIARESRQRKARKDLLQAILWLSFAFVLVAITATAARASGPVFTELHESGRMILAQSDGPLVWPTGAVVVYHNNKGAPMTDDEAQALIEYMSWSWSQRTDLSITYGGLTDQTEIKGAIVLQWASWFEMLMRRGASNVKGYVATSYFPSTGHMNSAQLVLMSTEWLGGFADSRKAATTAIHEMGHAIGIMGHNDDPEGVMYYARQSGRYALHASDVEMTGYNHNLCHAELTPHGDVYIPGIIGAGVTLKPVNGVLTLEHEHSSGSDCSGTWGGSEAVIYDVRGIDGAYQNVTLKPVDGGFEIVGYQGVDL